MAPKGLAIFSIVVGMLSGGAAAAGPTSSDSEGESDLNDVFLVVGIGVVVAVIVATVTYLITREEEQRG